MPDAQKRPDYSYIAYIDESGDSGLARVKPKTVPGSSEWLIVSAVVIPVDQEANVSGRVAGMMEAINSHQLRDLHFNKLNVERKELVCRYLTQKHVKCFSVCCNKQNMEGYVNPWAQQIRSDNWFYCWVTRLLLERVTTFVEAASLKRYGEVKKGKLEYSQRGGLGYDQMTAYYDWLRMKSRAENLFLPLGDLAWATMDRRLLEVHNHKDRDGLKLPDIVASAFFKAADIHDTGACDPKFAQLLKPRMARSPDTDEIAGFGVKLMPNWRLLRVQPEQREIFSFYGYPKQWWQQVAKPGPV
jgi:hypothetical protein